MFKHLALCLLLLPLAVTNACSTGCLRCTDTSATNTAKICVLCDTINDYYLENNDCVKNDDTHCLSLSSNGDCTVCDTKYYVDNVTKNCVAVETANQITSCLYYASATTCSTCASKYYLSDGECVNTDLTLISNCLYYGSATTCDICQNGYQVNSTQTACTSIGSTCIAYSEFECQTCGSSFIINKNLYKEDLYQFGTISYRDHLMALLTGSTYSYSTVFNTDVCQEGEIDNCAVYTDLENCKTCDNDYILDGDNLCQEQPLTMITNCAEYQAISGWNPVHTYQPQYECINCNQGYYVGSDNRCTAVSADNNCAEFATDENDECLICKTKFYLSNGRCTGYDDNEIPNCKTYKTTDFGCTACNDGYSLYLDSACFTSLDHCATYTSNGDCSTCDVGFYEQTDNVCAAVTGTKFCATNAPTADQCVTCQNQYFFDDSQSISCTLKHSNMSTCSTFSSSHLYQCQQCNDDYVTLQVANSCTTAITNVDSNCAEYDYTNDYCVRCSSGSLNTTNSSRTCDPRSTVSHCNIYVDDDLNTASTSVCTTCAEGYYLLINDGISHCLSDTPVIKDTCLDIDTITSFDNDFSTNCDICDEGSVPLDDSLDYFCLQQELWDIYDVNDVNGTTNNCAAINEDGVCTKCKTGKFYQSNLGVVSCLDSCNFSVSLEDGHMICGTTDVEISVDGAIFQCNDSDGNDYVNVVAGDNDASVTIGDISADVLGGTDDYIPHQLNVQPEITCSLFDNTSETIEGSSTFTSTFKNRLYELDGTDYKVQRCELGKYGTAYAGYVDCTQTLSTSQIYQVPAVWTKFFSITQCTLSTDTPVVALDIDGNAYSYAAWQYNSSYTGNDLVTTWTTSGDQNGKSITCVNLNDSSSIKSAFNLPSATTPTLMPNCGLAVLNLHVAPTAWDNSGYADSNGYATLNESLTCLACKPGYKTGITSAAGVANCVQITGCSVPVTATDKFFDGCPQCATNYIWQYNSGIVYNSCISTANKTKVSNCLAIESNSDNDTDCKVCKEGYTLTSNGTCVQATIPGCSTAVLSSGNSAMDLYLYQRGYGCTACSTGNVLFSPTQTVQVCATTADPVIANCKYQNNNSIYCNTCDDGYKGMFNGIGITSCVASTTCKQQTTGGNCTLCHDGYTLTTSHSCTPGTTTNCATYDVAGTLSQTTQACLTCNEGYIRTSTFQCVEGDIPNCKIYDQSVVSNTSPYQGAVCDTCDTGYLSVGNNCIDTSSIDNASCTSWAFQLNNGLAVLTCQTCSNLLHQPELYTDQHSDDGITGYVKENFTYQSYCLQVSKVASVSNCADQNFNVATNNNSYGWIGCDECSSGYYLADSAKYTCTARENNVSNCATFVVDEDLCQECNTGYFLGVETNYCYANPTHTDRCEQFDYNSSGVVECVYCEEDYFLDSSKICTALEAAQKVDNCLYHTGISQCGVCDDNYVLINNVCQQRTNRCSTYSSTGVCTNCETGYVLNSGNQCNAVSGCETSSGTICTACEPRYYLNSSNGCNPTTAVDNCDYYSSASVCSQCSAGYYLKTVNSVTTCVQISYDLGTGLNTNCLVAEEGYTCSICQAGQSFVDGSCRANTTATLTNGCFDEDDDGDCWFCISGWSMGTTGSCTDNNPDDSGVGIIGIIMGIMMLIFQQMREEESECEDFGQSTMAVLKFLKRKNRIKKSVFVEKIDKKQKKLEFKKLAKKFH